MVFKGLVDVIMFLLLFKERKIICVISFDCEELGR